jgi:hypothetical protein
MVRGQKKFESSSELCGDRRWIMGKSTGEALRDLTGGRRRTGVDVMFSCMASSKMSLVFEQKWTNTIISQLTNLHPLAKGIQRLVDG